jgi:hypothetical protein
MLTYVAQGYTIALVRGQDVAIQAATATLGFELGDRLFIFSANLQSDDSQFINVLMSCVQSEDPSPAAMVGQIAEALKGAIAYEGSVTMLGYRL